MVLNDIKSFFIWVKNVIWIVFIFNYIKKVIKILDYMDYYFFIYMWCNDKINYECMLCINNEWIKFIWYNVIKIIDNDDYGW